MGFLSFIPSPVLYGVIPFVVASAGFSYIGLQFALKDVECVIRRGEAEKKWREAWLLYALPLVGGLTLGTYVYTSAAKSGLVSGLSELASRFVPE